VACRSFVEGSCAFEGIDLGVGLVVAFELLDVVVQKCFVREPQGRHRGQGLEVEADLEFRAWERMEHRSLASVVHANRSASMNQAFEEALGEVGFAQEQ
jgi:hypothetical protein